MTERAAVTLNPSELLAGQTHNLEKFFGQEALPEPPKELLEFIERTSEKGFTFEPYLEPGRQFPQDAQYPGWRVKPQQWFYDQIRQGNISPDAARLPLGWAAMETIIRPNYDGGKQLYENDALAPILEDLRKRGRIAVPDWCKHIPSISRFGVSQKEISGFVASRFVDEIGKVHAQNVDATTYMAFNYLGNIAHPEFGEANTWERFSDKFGGDGRLIGGYSGHGGLARVCYDSSGGHVGRVGFRLRVVFPSNP